VFYPVLGGSVYEIPDNAFGFIFKCNLPKIGYGINSMTGELEETEILKRSDIPEEQYWERPTLPPDWKEKLKAEKERQEFDYFYFDPYLEKIRKREWHRRLCGIWFWNYNPKTKQSELRYITGQNYLYISWWRFQGKYMDFRIIDMEAWYVTKYCETDPNSLGGNEITKRKLGKTARLGCWIYERTSRMRHSHAGLQSKADDDASEVMKKAIVQPWQKLPEFFRPIYDTMKGDDPTEMRFFHSTRRGSSTEKEHDEDALESWIDYGASGEGVYDGPELDTYGSDESGKTKRPVNIRERQNVVRYCAEIDGEFKHRKQWYTTTVEPEKGEEENYEFQELTKASNPLERDDNGRTGTGLYTIFWPAQKGMYFDKYGYADEEKASKFIENSIRGYELRGDMRGLSSFKRKNPRTLKEAFSSDGELALFNPELLNRQLDDIIWTDKLTEFGDLKWIGGYKIKKPVVDANGNISYEPSGVEWISNPNGKFERIKGWEPKEPNKVYFNGVSYCPNNKNLDIGCDPFKYDKTKDKRRSNCAAFCLQSEDALIKSNPSLKNRFDNHFTLRYSFREESTRAANEDILKMAWWCGSSVLFERQVDHWKRDFVDWQCSEFIAWMPDEVEPGVAMTADLIQTICDYTEDYINQYIKNVFFKTLIRKETGWLGFKVEDTEKFDEVMGAGLTLVKKKGRTYFDFQEPNNSIENFFPRRRN
jgi:hypothetical protein